MRSEHLQVDSIQTRKVELVDTQGNVRIRLALSSKDGAPELTFYDQTKQQRICLGLGDQESPSLALLDEKEQKRLSLNLGSAGGPVMQYLDSEGTIRLQIHLSLESLSLLLLNKKGIPRANLFLTAEGEPHLALTDQSGKKSRVVTVSRDVQDHLDVDETLRRNGVFHG